MVIPILNNRDLSRRLGINLARWKRWSREFLPPDPLAGIQSGYARQYYLDDAFRVYLGGHLVSHLHLSVPEARQVLADLSPWLKNNGLCFDLRGNLQASRACKTLVQAYEVHFRNTGKGFAYRVRGLLERRLAEPGPPEVWTERWTETLINDASATGQQMPPDAICRSLQISRLASTFQDLVSNFNMLRNGDTPAL